MPVRHKREFLLMNNDNRELEVKFAIGSTAEIISRIWQLGAVCEQTVRFERNLRWDDPSGTLTKNFQVLRLRDNGGTAVLTFKAKRKNDEKLADREEIETVVSNYENTGLILERLGYEIIFIYEKYRSIYSLNETDLFVDHTPIGDYIEIEGPDAGTIRSSAELLGLDWEQRIEKSYSTLFKIWKRQTGFSGRDMTFASAEG